MEYFAIGAHVAGSADELGFLIGSRFQVAGLSDSRIVRQKTKNMGL